MGFLNSEVSVNIDAVKMVDDKGEFIKSIYRLTGNYTGGGRCVSEAGLTRYLMAGADLEIQMNPDHMNELFFLIQCVGVRRFHTEFKEHGGEWRVFRFIHKSQLREDSASWPVLRNCCDH